MRCKEYIKYLGPYMDSELDTKTCVEIASHLESCQDCRTRFSQEQEIERLLAEKLREERMPKHMWNTVQRSVHTADDTPESVSGRWFNLRWFVPAVAAVALVIGLSIFFFWVKTPEVKTLALALQEVHERYLSDEITVKGDVVWPKGFEQTALPGRLPRSGNIGGHDIELLGGRPYYVGDVELALLEYRCCGEPISVFVLRKEDLENFPRARDLLDSNKGSVSVASENTNLMMVDVGDAVVCGASSHELNTFLKAFERV